MLTIPTPNQHTGRLAAVELAVLHAAQAPCRAGVAEAVLRYLARPEVRASAHWCTDPANTVAGVAEANTAWGAPNANANGIHIHNEDVGGVVHRSARVHGAQPGAAGMTGYYLLDKDAR